MVDNVKLSEGSLQEIMRGAQLNDPIMQVLGTKKITPNSSEKERYRILLSDGKHLISFAMLTTQVGERAISAEIAPFSVIKIKRYITSVINNAGKSDKRVLVILDMEILVAGEVLGHRIGNPQQLPEDDSSQAQKVTTAPTPAVVATTSKDSQPTSIVQNKSGLDLQLTHPITSLSPYQNKWVIRVKVQFKSPIRTWSNSKGEGRLFSVDLVDESGEIRATGFRDQVDKYYEFLEIDKVYYISKAQIKIANKQFSHLKNEYEMTFSNETIIQECHEMVDSIPDTKYDFLLIDKLAHMEVGTLVDVIAICKSASDVVTFQARSGRELKKRDVCLVDQTLNTIDLTLWGTVAENFDASNQPVVALKGAKITEFGGGKSVTTLANTIMKLNPDMPEAHRLKGWFDNGGLNQNTVNISARTGDGGYASTPWLSFREVSENALGNSEKGDYYQTVATILLVRAEKCVYRACPTDNCQKKVVDMSNGMYRCEKCNREYPNFKHRLLTSMNIADWSGNLWVNVFAEEAEKIVGATSAEVGVAFDAGTDSLTSILEVANFKEFHFKLRAKVETFNDESRLKTVVLKAEPVDYKQYNAFLLSKLEQNI